RRTSPVGTTSVLRSVSPWIVLVRKALGVDIGGQSPFLSAGGFRSTLESSKINLADRACSSTGCAWLRLSDQSAEVFLCPENPAKPRRSSDQRCHQQRHSRSLNCS